MAHVAEHVGYIHPAFRIIALGLPPSPEHRWLTSETLSLFNYHHLRSMNVKEHRAMLGELFPAVPKEAMDALMRFTAFAAKESATAPGGGKEDIVKFNAKKTGGGGGGHVASASAAKKKENASPSTTTTTEILSTRHLIRLCRRMASYPETALTDLGNMIHDTLMSQVRLSVSLACCLPRVEILLPPPKKKKLL
jgi:hypothetical protein